MNKTTAYFQPGQTVVCAASPLYQYDYGQILEISGLDLPAAFTVDFGLCDATTTVTVLGEDNAVGIPDAYLLTGKSINAFIFLHTGEDDGETEYRITIAVIPRPRRTQETPTPVEQSLIDQAIASLNAGVTTAEGYADYAAASAALAAAAVAHYPTIIGGVWYVWEAEANAYVSTGVQARGEDGFSPTVTVTAITGGHRVTITDAAGPHTFDVMDGRGSGVGAVESVNGKTGAVTLTASDVGALPSDADLDSIPDGTTYKRPTGSQLQQISANAAAIQTQGGEIDALQADVDAIEGKIPAQASASNQLADKAFVNSSVQTNTAHFRGNWATWADVPSSAADYPADDDGNTTPTTNDYMVVQDASGYPVAAGEDALTGTWRFKYTGIWAGYGKSGWKQEYQVNETPLTSAQLAALNSGATAEIIASIADKLDTTGDGSNVTVAFTAASTRTAIATGEKLSVLLGKIAKWLADLGSAAWKNATNAVTNGSSDLVESGAVYTAVSAKYTKPSTGIPGTDLAPGVIPTVPSDIGAAAADLGITGAAVGDLIKITAVDGSGKPTAFAEAVAGTDYATPASVTAKADKPDLGTISLTTTWSGNGPYTQPVTVTGATVTANSKVDLQPDATVLAQLISDGVTALLVTNNNGTLTATAIGAETTAALTIQCTVTEVTA